MLTASAGPQKCEHGNRILKGEEFARYCSGCNPSSNYMFAREPKRPRRGLSLVGAFVHSGKPQPLAVADWLEELALYGQPARPQDAELANQLSLAVENWFLVHERLS